LDFLDQAVNAGAGATYGVRGSSVDATVITATPLHDAGGGEDTRNTDDVEIDTNLAIAVQPVDLGSVDLGLDIDGLRRREECFLISEESLECQMLVTLYPFFFLLIITR